MNVQFKTLVAASLSVCALAACSSKTDLNEKNFTVAIQQQLDKSSPDLCIWFTPSQDVPVGADGTAPKDLQALETVGLISGVSMEKDSPYWIQLPGSTAPIPKVKFKRYTLTAEGKNLYKEIDLKKTANNSEPHFYAEQAPTKAGAFCYGKVAVDKVVKWTAPVQNGSAQVVQVTYLYKVNDLADWAKNPAIQASIFQIKDMLDGASKKELVQELMLTNLGWEATNTQ